MAEEKLALVAALEREIRPLVRGWAANDRTIDGRTFRFYQHDGCIAVAAGIGPEAARRASVAAIALYHPQRLVSVGFAGALDRRMHIGDIVRPATVVNAADGSRTQTAQGQGSLVSFPAVAGAAQKARLASAFAAQAVDMEAASVAAAAAAAGTAFDAIKAISDELDFELPLMDRYIDSSGQFQTAKFAIAAALRPWLWNRLRLLARNSAIASRSLCDYLSREAGV